jgi:hypothetical protein
MSSASPIGPSEEGAAGRKRGPLRMIYRTLRRHLARQLSGNTFMLQMYLICILCGLILFVASARDADARDWLLESQPWIWGP